MEAEPSWIPWLAFVLLKEILKGRAFVGNLNRPAFRSKAMIEQHENRTNKMAKLAPWKTQLAPRMAKLASKMPKLAPKMAK